jgi:probable F420-dependent oxidoreductase
MKLDVRLGGGIEGVRAAAREAEALGFDGGWTWEVGQDPFLPVALAAIETPRLELGTSIAVAFPRSPVVTAQLAWDLQRLSRGRFLLGLGTQVKGHIERRYGLPWDEPAPRLRDYLGALRAIWTAWQDGTPLDYRGRFYTHTLMPPFFRPAPLASPGIPVQIAGVQPAMCRLAGEVADGLHVHPFHSVRYLREIVVPAREAGARTAGRDVKACPLVASALVATGETAAALAAAREDARRQLAFYASTPNYRGVLECHGWEGVARELTRKSVRGEWEAMAALITDEMLDVFAVVGSPDDAAKTLHERYDGLVGRLAVYDPLRPGGDHLPHRALLAAFPHGAGA